MMSLRGREVLLPAYSCPFFADLILKEKIRPVFLDADLGSFNVSPEEVKEKVSRRTAAVILIHTYGAPCKVKPILDLKEEFGFFLIEDCAHALGAKYRGKSVGCFGDISLFSMYKTIPNFGGGFLVINTKELFKDFKKEKEKLSLSDLALLMHKMAPHLETKILKKLIGILPRFRAEGGSKLVPLRRCNDLVKAIFNFYFDEIPKWIKSKEKIAKEYSRRIRKIDLAVSQRVDGESAWMNYSVRVLDQSVRNNVLREMKKRGILCDKMWYDLPIYSRELKRKYRLKLAEFKNAVLLSRSVLNLPLHHHFRKRDTDFICDAFASVLSCQREKLCKEKS
jgi:dTDP-4-amino-4,6-dideoxygalactose transaminase